MSMSADIHPILPSSASPAVEDERGRPQCKLQRGRGPSGAQRYLAVHRLPVQQTPKRWRGSEPLDAEQMTVLSREQIRGMFSLPFPSPSAWLDAVVSPQICSIRHWYPHVGKQDLSLRQHNTCRSGKRLSCSIQHPSATIWRGRLPRGHPTKAPRHHQCPQLLVPCGLGWALPGLSGARGPVCRWARALQ